MNDKIAERVAVMEAQMESLIERLGDRIELAIKSALDSYTHVDDHSSLAIRVKELEDWKSNLSGERRIETKHADAVRDQVHEWARTIFPYVLSLATVAYLFFQAVTR